MLEGSRLVLSADSPVWGSRLRFLIPDLLTQLRREYPGIANIQIRIASGQQARASDTRTAPRPRPACEKAARAVEQASAGIADTALAKALQRLARTLRKQ